MHASRHTGSLAWGWASVSAVLIRRSAAASAPPYNSLRYEEDYRYLRDTTQRSDTLDPIKLIPLGGSRNGDSRLTLGGEMRQRYEFYRNAFWGQGSQDSNGYLLQRYMLHADVHVGETFRTFAQLRHAAESGRVGGPRATDEDTLDLHQAFFDVSWKRADQDSFTLRLGRQEMSFGSSRLISTRESPNMRLSFDGARGIYRRGRLGVDVLAVEPVQIARGTFNDRADSGQKLWGLYATGPLNVLPGSHLDLYYLGRRRDAARYDQDTERETRHSLGARWWGRQAGWDYNFEFVHQFGTFGDGDISAWTVASDTGYTFASTSGTPRLGLKVDIASGDRDPQRATLQTFNALFPRGAYFSESALIGPANIIDLHPTVSVQPTKTLTLSADWDFFWRESTHDGLYGTAVNLVRSGRSSAARYIGSQPSFTAEWRPSRHWSVTACYAYFFAGKFLRESRPGGDVTYASAWVTYKI